MRPAVGARSEFLLLGWGRDLGRYLFLYSIYYAATRLQMARAVAGVLYVGYMFIISFSLFLVTGAIGFLACLAFVRAIYSAIKID
jgi:transmembrane 9 superfamily protein 2/4